MTETVDLVLCRCSKRRDVAGHGPWERTGTSEHCPIHAGVIKLQREHGLVVDGIVGVRTASLMDREGERKRRRRRWWA